jgi:hypothetical protein
VTLAKNNQRFFVDCLFVTYEEKIVQESATGKASEFGGSESGKYSLRVSYNGITSAFQADDAGPIPATRSI